MLHCLDVAKTIQAWEKSQSRRHRWKSPPLDALWLDLVPTWRPAPPSGSPAFAVAYKPARPSPISRPVRGSLTLLGPLKRHSSSQRPEPAPFGNDALRATGLRSEEHTSELQSR